MRALWSLIFCALLSAAAAAQSFPSRPVRVIVPFPPAGITDLSARLVAEGLRAKFNQPVIVENKPGANGLIGLREMLKAEPDGYTLMAGTVGNLVIGYAMEVNPSFDALRDVIPIAGTAEYATAMVVNNKTPAHSVNEFIDYAKARAGKLTFGSTGPARSTISPSSCSCVRPARGWCTCPTAAGRRRCTTSWAARSTCSSRCSRWSWSRSNPARSGGSP